MDLTEKIIDKPKKKRKYTRKKLTELEEVILSPPAQELEIQKLGSTEWFDQPIISSIIKRSGNKALYFRGDAMYLIISIGIDVMAETVLKMWSTPSKAAAEAKYNSI